MENEAVKNTPALLAFGVLFLLFFGLWLRKVASSYDFTKRSKLFFLLDNYNLVGGVLFGILLIVIALFL